VKHAPYPAHHLPTFVCSSHKQTRTTRRDAVPWRIPSSTLYLTSTLSRCVFALPHSSLPPLRFTKATFLFRLHAYYIMEE
jgi:hypothetical protein